jgi:hypothetical protein
MSRLLSHDEGRARSEGAVEGARRARDAAGDIGDREVRVCPQSTGDPQLCIIERARAPTTATTSDGSGAASSSAHLRLFCGQLGEAGEQVDGKAASGRFGVDVLGQRLQADVALGNLIDDVEQLAHISGKSVEAVNADDISGAAEVQRHGEFRAALELDGGARLNEGFFATRFFQSVDLMGVILRSGADARVADENVL